jgi:hypothetical protein
MKNYTLRITLSDFSGAVGVANYSTFKILNNVTIYQNYQFVKVFETQVVVSTSGAIQLIRDTFQHFLSKGLYTRDILTHNIAIKRYCDKKYFRAIDFY